MHIQLKTCLLAGLASLATEVHASLTLNRPFGSSFGIVGVNATYDYVVVGGGTAGLTVASRLREQGAGSVAVIEAGSFYELTAGNLSQVPASAPSWAGKSEQDSQPLADWDYMTTPQDVSALPMPVMKVASTNLFTREQTARRFTIPEVRCWEVAVAGIS
jgi:choline dehydrogenase